MAFKKNYYKNIKEKSIIDPETGCWIFQGKARHVQGYGFARHDGKMKTIQRGMAEELELFPDINFYSRISTSCSNKLCSNPDHIICLTHSEVNDRRYATHGTHSFFNDDSSIVLLNEYEELEGTPGRVKILSDQYNCAVSVIYRNLDRARLILKK